MVEDDGRTRAARLNFDEEEFKNSNVAKQAQQFKKNKKAKREAEEKAKAEADAKASAATKKPIIEEVSSSDNTEKANWWKEKNSNYEEFNKASEELKETKKKINMKMDNTMEI